jgi:hypothetical protein
LLASGYATQCTVRACRARATRLARYTDGQGRPLRQRELCDRHADWLKANRPNGHERLTRFLRKRSRAGCKIVTPRSRPTTARSSRLLPSWSTPSSAPFPKKRKTRSEKSKPWFLRVNCYAEQSTKSDENAPAQADSAVPLRSQRRHKASGVLERFGLLERFTPYVSGGRGSVRGDEAKAWLTDRRNEAIAEVTLVVSAIAMAAAIVAAVRR